MNYVLAANSYTLPNLLGKTIESSKPQAAIFTQRGRSTIGGFSEDLQKVQSSLVVWLCG